MSSTSTGASNGITIVADNTTLDFTNSGGTGGVDTLQAAQDAVAIVGDPALNPVTVTRSTTYIVTNDEYADPFEAVCDEQYADIADENVLDISNDTALYFETETR